MTASYLHIWLLTRFIITEPNSHHRPQHISRLLFKGPSDSVETYRNENQLFVLNLVENTYGAVTPQIENYIFVLYPSRAASQSVL